MAANLFPGSLLADRTGSARSVKGLVATETAGLAAVVVSVSVTATAAILLRHVLLIATPEGIPVSIANLPGNIRMTVLVAVVHIWPAMIVKILAGAFHAILKPAALDVAAHILPIAVAVRTAPLLVISSHRLLEPAGAVKVRNAPIVTAAKSLLIRFALFGGKMRISILVAIVHVGTAVIVEILARAHDPIVKTLTLHIPQILRRPLPVIPILCSKRGRRSQRRAISSGRRKSCSSQEKGECRY
jgi:hypothetical protein